MTVMTVTDTRVIFGILQTGELEGVRFPYVYIYEGTNGEKGLYAVFTALMNVDIHRSPYVKSAVCLLREGRLTEAGGEFLKENGRN